MKKKSYAKINLGLKVFPKMDNGYHSINSIFTTINFYDIIKIKKAKEFKIIGNESVKEEDDLMYKAFMLMKEKYNLKSNIIIKIKKNIPQKAGLGGGSSNLACTMNIINKLFKLKLSVDELERLSLTLGSDASYFIESKTSYISGLQDKKELVKHHKIYIVLVVPFFEVSTKDAFEKFDKLNSSNYNYEDTLKHYKNFNFKMLQKSIKNDLDFDDLLVKDVKEKMILSGAKSAYLTGSGSCIYSIFENRKETKKVYKKFKKSYSALAKKLILTSSIK